MADTEFQDHSILFSAEGKFPPPPGLFQQFQEIVGEAVVLSLFHSGDLKDPSHSTSLNWSMKLVHILYYARSTALENPLYVVELQKIPVGAIIDQEGVK